MDKIVNFPFVPLNIYEEYKILKKNTVVNDDTFILLLQNLINDAKLKNNKESKLSKLILFDFKNILNHPVINKEKSTASALEKRIALLGNGNMLDNLSKKAPKISSLLKEDEYLKLSSEIQNKICSNFREKGDIGFNNGYKISIKSLMDNNKEINFGAFEFSSLIRGILSDDFLSLGERKCLITKVINDKTFEIGRGSRKQLSQLFDYIKEIGKWDIFLERFKIVLKGVFKEDILIYKKNYKYLNFYIIKNKTFIDCIYNSLLNTYDTYSDMILNRWEGNSLRVDRDLLLKNADYFINENFETFFNENDLNKKFEEAEDIKYNILLNNFEFSTI